MDPEPDFNSLETDAGSIAEILETFGCPSEKCDEMAYQLLKRADQLSQERLWTRVNAIRHLLQLMAAAATARNASPGQPVAG